MEENDLRYTKFNGTKKVTREFAKSHEHNYVEIQRRVREEISKLKNLYGNSLTELKRIAKPSSEEAGNILEVMLSPDYFRVDPNNIFEEYSIAWTPIACIQDLCKLVATYEGIKKGSAFLVFDPEQKNNPHTAISNARIPSDKLEDLLISLKLKYKKVRSKTHYVFWTAKDEEHLKLCNQIIQSESQSGKECHYLRGIFFDYPRCCVEKFSDECEQDDKRRPQIEFKRKILKVGKDKVGEDVLFATCFFVPCSIDCSNAAKKGRDIFDTLKRTYGVEFAKKVRKALVESLFIRC